MPHTIGGPREARRRGFGCARRVYLLAIATLEAPAAVALLEEDPDLAVGLSADELADAERVLVVPGLSLEPGEWDIREVAQEPTLGLLVLDGFLTVNIVLADRVASQLAGPGDLLYPECATEGFVPARVRHFVSEPARLAVLDRRFIAGVRRWPALLLALHDRQRAQERRVAVHGAIGKLRRVEDRILALLWHLAERWGRVTPEGVLVPLALTHETLGRLVGAERPTVTLALGELERSEHLARRATGGFVLSDVSREHLAPGAEERPQLRPLAVALTPEGSAPSPSAEATTPRLVDVEAVRERVAALADELP